MPIYLKATTKGPIRVLADDILEVIVEIPDENNTATMWINGQSITPDMIVIPPRAPSSESPNEYTVVQETETAEKTHKSCTDMNTEISMPYFKDNMSELMFRYIKRWAINNPERKTHLVKVFQDIMRDIREREPDALLNCEPTISAMRDILREAQNDGCITVIPNAPVSNFDRSIKSNIVTSPIEKLYADQLGETECDSEKSSLSSTPINLDDADDPITAINQLIYYNVVDWAKSHPGHNISISNLYSVAVSKDMQQISMTSVGYQLSEHDLMRNIPLLMMQGWITMYRDVTGRTTITSIVPRPY